MSRLYPTPDEWTQGILDRIIELVKTDPPLHDAVVRFLNARAEETEIANARRRKRR